MGILNNDFHSQIELLTTQLEQYRLSQRDNSLRSQREKKTLIRLIHSLCESKACENDPLSEHLVALSQDLEQQKDISKLVPKLAVLERKLKNHTLKAQKKHSELNERIQYSGQALQRLAGLPAQLKRELRHLLSSSNAQSPLQIEHASKLLSIYERCVKILASNSTNKAFSSAQFPDKDLLSDLSEELQSLINTLDFQAEYGEQLLDIRSKLLMGVSSSALYDLTLQTLRLVIEGMQCERKASQHFLEHLSQSISSSLESSELHLDQNMNYFQHRRELNAQLEQLTLKSQTAIRHCDDVEQIKQTVSPLLAQIAALSERLVHAEKREATLQDRMQHSLNQLQSTFETTQDYSKNIDDQAKRALQDPLTKIYNRTALMDRLELEYRRWVRSQHSLRVILLDIDNFKMINDSFGYVAGDKALKIIARMLSKEVADTDMLARFSGEEFIIILPEHNDDYCYQLISRIQEQIYSLPFKFREQLLSISVSAASTVFNNADTTEIVLERLYKDLREARSFGPNQLTWK
ncbi:diguanylate cyclase [Vibrio sp. 10N.286.49.B3]|uniref:GGDEF domain-containing protein n=1 Tax=Vibrio sp. 10N.286.49.B3 TaxID=1880855 RepID=UPI000C842688|nr:GGDEF domain-containing protein [Vibrio sp. 10N.286.49.B3]PMH37503.1 diguanylate cyclase [Vibrio sp. 10N.286.49.B3]